MTIRNIQQIFNYKTKVTINEIVFDEPKFGDRKVTRLVDHKDISDLTGPILDREVDLIIPHEHSIYIETWISTVEDKEF